MEMLIANFLSNFPSRLFFPVSQLETTFLLSFFLINLIAKTTATHQLYLSFLSKYTKDMVKENPYLSDLGYSMDQFTICKYSSRLSTHIA